MNCITIYSTKTCLHCKDIKDFLNDNSLSYCVRDVGRDLVARKEMVDKSGQMGVPVTIIGEKVFVGFNESVREEVSRELNLK